MSCRVFIDNYYVCVQFNSVVPKVMVSSLRHSGVNGKRHTSNLCGCSVAHLMKLLNIRKILYASELAVFRVQTFSIFAHVEIRPRPIVVHFHSVMLIFQCRARSSVTE